jgi:pimeloyl-ACP methyl ester carboxylesterase
MKPFKDYAWRSKDGLHLHAREYGTDVGKLPVVCIPGLTRNCRDFEELAPWIAARGRRVLAVDLRGRGQSDRDPVSKRYAPATYAADMAALLASIGAPRALVVGTSLGGLVTMMLAYRMPGIIGGAVINDVGPRIAKAGGARIAGYAGRSAEVKTWAEAAAYARRINGAAFPNYRDADWSTFARRVFKEDAAGGPVLDYDPKIVRVANPVAAWLARPLLWAAFKRLGRCGPVLLVRGALSDILDAPTVRRMQRAAQHMTVVEVANVGHAPMLDEPEARIALAAFFDAAP